MASYKVVRWLTARLDKAPSGAPLRPAKTSYRVRMTNSNIDKEGSTKCDVGSNIGGLLIWGENGMG